MLKVGEADRGAGWKRPCQDVLFRFRAKQWIELHALVPQAALVADLDRGAAEEDGAELSVVDVAQGLHQKRPRLTPASSPAVDRDVGRAA